MGRFISRIASIWKDVNGTVMNKQVQSASCRQDSLVNGTPTSAQMVSHLLSPHCRLSSGNSLRMHQKVSTGTQCFWVCSFAAYTIMTTWQPEMMTNVNTSFDNHAESTRRNACSATIMLCHQEACTSAWAAGKLSVRTLCHLTTNEQAT